MAMNRTTLLGITAFCLLNQLVYADMNSANAALARGDYNSASKEFLRLAKDGNAKAQTHLGYMYYVGEGVAQDYSEAIKWYRKASVQGDKDAQYNLAVAYAFGEGTKQDYKEAAIWYRRASEQGHVIAQYSLGISYSYGEGVKQDSAEAVKWFQRSANQGYARAQIQLASKYHTGDGVALDYQEAVKWYRQAADRGNAAAQYNLGSMFRSGKGVKQDYNQAIRWYRLAADQGYSAATNELASLERAIAGATRTRSKPDLQPRPAPVEQVAKAEAPAEEPLLTVEKSDLLSLDDEEEQVEEAVVAEVEPVVEAVADTYEEAEVAEQMEPEKKKPGRISGFFKKFFKKKDTQPETIMVEATETAAIEDDSQMVMESSDAIPKSISEEAVPVEDLSQPMVDSSEEITSEREVVSNEPVEKKSRFGFFKKLFGKKKTNDEVSVEDHSVVAMEAESSTDTEADAVLAYGTETNVYGDELTDTSESATSEDLQEDVTALEAEVSSDMDVSEAEVKPKKKGFFSRLFGKKKDQSEDVAETELEDSAQMPADSIAMVDDSTDNIPILEEEVSIDTRAEEDAAMDALETETKPKKKGFFRRLFSKSDEKPEQADSESEESADVTESAAAVYPSEPAYIADAEDLEVGQQALDEGNYDAAFNSFYELATRGDATAQHQLGLLYYQGLGVAQNYDEASHWYRLAGEQGNANAQYSLGNMFLMGEGVDQDDSQAIFWYEKAADQGHVAAQHNVNNLKRVTSTTSVSAEEIETALENEQMDNASAGTQDVAEDKPKKGFFKRLFGKKDKAVEEEVSDAAVQGPLPALQPDEEVTEVEEVKQKKKGFFSRLFGKKDAEDVEADETADAQAEQMESMATSDTAEPEQSFEEALTAVNEYEKGLAYSFGDGVPQDNKAAFEAFLRSAELGHTPAQYKTGIAYAYGEGVDKDPKQAVLWYKKAAEKGYALAQRNLGVMYMNGEGIEQNKPLAFAWHSILADGGNVMDVHRRDSLQQLLSEAELEEARAIKASLKH